MDIGWCGISVCNDVAAPIDGAVVEVEKALGGLSGISCVGERVII
jgi:hypothetical protein